MSLLKSTKGTIYGGSGDPKTNFIELTLISNLSTDDILFNDEIFGPLLPILTYQSLAEIPSIIDKIAPTPLALYLMSEDQSEASYIVDHTSSGGVAINDLYSQVAVPGMAFGGVGTSGDGKMHGKAGFDIFTNQKAVCTVPTGAEYEAMTEFRYSTGDLEAKYQMLKGMEEKMV